MAELIVSEAGTPLSFTFADIMKFHGPGFPGGVAHAFQAMRAAFPLLSEDPLERREIQITTAFTGPGGRDAMELVTRAVSDGRITMDRSLGGHDVISDPPGPYLWRFGYRGDWVEATIRPGHVLTEFVALGATPDRNAEQEARLTFLKAEMAERLLGLVPEQVYEARRI